MVRRFAVRGYCRGVLDENTQAIVAMAWARAFGLPDDTFAAVDGVERRTVAHDGGEITVLQLLGRTVLMAPQWALDEADDYTDDVLVSVAGLLDLAKDHQPRATSVQALLYADDYLKSPGLERADVTGDPQAVRDLLPRCAPDDVHGAGLVEHDHRFVLLDDDEQPTAAAAYSTVHGILADLAFVGAIEARGTGALEVATAIAMHDALDAGLIPQLRIGVDDSSSAAQTLGFERLGTLATVVIAD